MPSLVYPELVEGRYELYVKETDDVELPWRSSAARSRPRSGPADRADRQVRAGDPGRRTRRRRVGERCRPGVLS